jgi:uncharacterized membrane protein YhaH (DUF805 family)
MKPKFSDLWRWDGIIGRGPYLFWGVCLFAIKYNLDRIISRNVFGKSWTLFDLNSLRFYLWQSPVEKFQETYYLTFLAVALPFLWAGVVLTLRRLRSLGWSPWWVLLFFVPFLKLFFFTLLCFWPARSTIVESPGNGSAMAAGKFGRFIPCQKLGSATLGVSLSAVLGLLAIWLGTSVLGDYGWTLFLGLPFVVGFLSALIHCYHAPRSMNSCVLTAMTAIALVGAGLLAVAMEGMICLVMAAPIAVLMSVAGGVIGCLLQHTIWHRTRSARLYCAVVLAIPTAMGVEHTVPPPLPKLQVQSSVIIDAPPEKVWKNVVTFSQLPEPTEMIFKLGVAYPIRAEIDGQGVGTIRRCNFSTGPFVEPIEVWDEPRLLKFSVTQNPEPMQEWTPYREIHPPHLHGYLESCGGQFRLVPLDGGRTQLEGTTWYYHHLWPADYWQLWSDQIIHTIHLRVLNHIKKLSEAK